MIPDPQTIAATFTAVRGVVKQFSDTTWKASIIDLQNLLMDLQGQAMDLQQALHQAQMRVRELEQQLAAKHADPKDGLALERGVWWAGESRLVSPDGPFCPKCLDADKERRLLNRHGRNNWANCLHCKNNFNVWPEDQQPPAGGVVRRRGWL